MFSGGNSCMPYSSPYMQVIDGFHVKTTADIRESVAYLTIMTRVLQKHYAVSVSLVFVGNFKILSCTNN